MIQVDGRGKRTSPDRTVAALWPTDDHVSSHHPIVWHPDSIAQHLFAAVGGPARQARTQALCAGGQQEVLHRRKDRTARQQIRRHPQALLGEQHRGELGGPIVELVSRPGCRGRACCRPRDRACSSRRPARSLPGRRAAAIATTARCSSDRSTMNRHAWALAPDGAHVAACRHRARVASSTGSSDEAPDRPGGGHHFPDIAACSPHAHEPTAQPRNDSVTIEITII